MSPRSQKFADIEVVFSSELAPLARRLAKPPASHRLRDELIGVMDQLGLPILARVAITEGNPGRPLIVRLWGEMLSYQPELAKEVWVSTVRPQHRGAVYVNGSSTGFPSTWLSEWIQEVQGEDALSDATAFAVRLTVEVLRRSASRLVTRAVTGEYLRNLVPGRPLPEDPHEMTDVLKVVVGAGLSLANHQQVAAQLDTTRQTWLLAPERAELLIELMHPIAVQVRGQVATLAQLAGVSPEADGYLPTGAVEAIQRGRNAISAAGYEELGVRMPPVDFVPDINIAPGQVVIRVAHQASVGYVVPPAGTVIVREIPDKLAASHGVSAEWGLYPGTAEPIAYVADHEVERLTNSGLPIMTPFQWLMVAVQTEVFRRPMALLQVRHVLVELGLILDVFPELVRNVMSLYAPTEIAQRLRELFREGVSIRDLRSILERLAVSAVVPSGPDALAELRLGIKEQIVYQAGHRTGRFFYFRLEPDLATIALTVGTKISTGQSDASSESSLLAVRDAVWGAVRRFHPETPPAIVTSVNSRLALRCVIEAEMPSVPILSEAEIAGFKQATEIATLAVP